MSFFNPIKDLHNSCRSARHSWASLHVCQSVYSSASCRVDQSSSTYLWIFSIAAQVRAPFHWHACTSMKRFAQACTSILPYWKWNIVIQWQLQIKSWTSTGQITMNVYNSFICRTNEDSPEAIHMTWKTNQGWGTCRFSCIHRERSPKQWQRGE